MKGWEFSPEFSDKRVGKPATKIANRTATSPTRSKNYAENLPGAAASAPSVLKILQQGKDCIEQNFFETFFMNTHIKD